LISENQEIDDRSRMFSVFKPKANMKLYPIYEESTRPYFIDLYDYNGEYIAEITTNYNTALKTALREYAYYNYRPDDENLGENERYVLEGWISETDYRNNTPNPTLIDLENTFVLTDKIELYAKYKSENYLENASHPCLFRFDNVTFNDTLTNEKISGI
jgi:hypothetical protein